MEGVAGNGGPLRGKTSAQFNPPFGVPRPRTPFGQNLCRGEAGGVGKQKNLAWLYLSGPPKGETPCNGPTGAKDGPFGPGRHRGGRACSDFRGRLKTVQRGPRRGRAGGWLSPQQCATGPSGRGTSDAAFQPTIVSQRLGLGAWVTGRTGLPKPGKAFREGLNFDPTAVFSGDCSSEGLFCSASAGALGPGGGANGAAFNGFGQPNLTGVACPRACPPPPFPVGGDDFGNWGSFVAVSMGIWVDMTVSAREAGGAASFFARLECCSSAAWGIYLSSEGGMGPGDRGGVFDRPSRSNSS